jgi:precorrin-8X/cobalt-precorrin-8 methylmutase
VEWTGDHPIFTESIRRIRELLAALAADDPVLSSRLAGLSPLERDVLERCIHSSGDVSIAADLRFSPADRFLDTSAAAAGTGAWGAIDPAVTAVNATSGPDAGLGACGRGLAALLAGAPILTDTAMAAAAVAPMARRTLSTAVHNLLDWAPAQAPEGSTRSAAAVASAWQELTVSGASPVVLIGSAPTALERLLDLVAAGAPPPSLLIGMPVGFVGVAESKRRLAQIGLDHIRLEGSRGGAGLVAAACNALLRAGGLAAEERPSPF